MLNPRSSVMQTYMWLCALLLYVLWSNSGRGVFELQLCFFCDRLNVFSLLQTKCFSGHLTVCQTYFLKAAKTEGLFQSFMKLDGQRCGNSQGSLPSILCTISFIASSVNTMDVLKRLSKSVCS